MDIIALAKELYKADFLLAQTDCPYENHKLTFLVSELEKLPSADAIRLLMAVLEVKDIEIRCPEGIPSGLSNMSEFPYLESKLKWYNPRNL